MEFSNYEGKCKYCGNIQPIMAADQVDADEKVSEDCECEGANTEKKKISAAENLQKICVTDCGRYGQAPLEDEELKIVKNCLNAVLTETVDKIIIDVAGTKIKIQTSNEKIKISRTKTKQMSAES